MYVMDFSKEIVVPREIDITNLVEDFWLDDGHLKNYSTDMNNPAHGYIRFDVAVEGSIGVWVGTSCEENYSFFSVYISSTEKHPESDPTAKLLIKLTGRADVRECRSSKLSPGTHYLHLTYTKQFPNPHGEDRGRIRKIEFPVNPTPGSAGGGSMAPMVNVHNTWLPAKKESVNVNGAWLPVKGKHVNVNGTWVSLNKKGAQLQEIPFAFIEECFYSAYGRTWYENGIASILSSYGGHLSFCVMRTSKKYYMEAGTRLSLMVSHIGTGVGNTQGAKVYISKEPRFQPSSYGQIIFQQASLYTDRSQDRQFVSVQNNVQTSGEYYLFIMVDNYQYANTDTELSVKDFFYGDKRIF